jgi:hypothetical protein
LRSSTLVERKRENHKHLFLFPLSSTETGWPKQAQSGVSFCVQFLPDISKAICLEAAMNTEITLLENVDVTEGTHYALKETALDLFAFEANMALQHGNAEEQQAYGIVLHYNEQEKLFIEFLKQQDRWTLAVESTGIAPVINRVLALSSSFNPSEQHTLRIVQQSDHVVILVDGNEVLKVSEAFRLVQPGLFTHTVSVAFTDVEQAAL